jgi:hypothetical protein
MNRRLFNTWLVCVCAAVATGIADALGWLRPKPVFNEQLEPEPLLGTGSYRGRRWRVEESIYASTVEHKLILAGEFLSFVTVGDEAHAELHVQLVDFIKLDGCEYGIANSIAHEMLAHGRFVSDYPEAHKLLAKFRPADSVSSFMVRAMLDDPIGMEVMRRVTELEALAQAPPPPVQVYQGYIHRRCSCGR